MMLELTAVSKTFRAHSSNEVRALDDVDLILAEGDFVTVIGSNGAGKSTLLKTISGLIVPDAGTVAIGGRDITRLPVHSRAALIGRISQDPQDSVCASMTIAENLAMASRRGEARGLRRAVGARNRPAFRTQLAEIGMRLEDRLDTPVGTLSGGQRQAVALLMATVGAPQMLLLDEHLAALDPRIAVAVMELTASLIGSGRLTTLMVTHNMAEAIRWGNRLVMMHAGRIIFEAAGAAKTALTIAELVERFHAASSQDLVDDRALLI